MYIPYTHTIYKIAIRNMYTIYDKVSTRVINIEQIIFYKQSKVSFINFFLISILLYFFYCMHTNTILYNTQEIQSMYKKQIEYICRLYKKKVFMYFIYLKQSEKDNFFICKSFFFFLFVLFPFTFSLISLIFILRFFPYSIYTICFIILSIYMQSCMFYIYMYVLVQYIKSYIN